MPTYLAATFANYTTPFGQAGGEPFIAYVLSADTEASYEESLASVSTADLMHLLPFLPSPVSDSRRSRSPGQYHQERARS